MGYHCDDMVRGEKYIVVQYQPSKRLRPAKLYEILGWVI